jgi:8-oxo-dGTP pyrophosphatase MutT (NUDIX family)
VTLAPEQLRSLLLLAEPLLPASGMPRAAVLLLISAGPQPQTFLTVRSADLPTHPGQISLPGGLVAAHDLSMEATALREAHEETGLEPASVSVLGRLPGVVVTVSGVEITPVVAWANEEPQLRPDPREVAEIIRCPLQHVLQPAHYRRESLLRDGQRREFWVIDVQQHRVWGATAAILYSLACLLHPASD